MNLPLLDVIQNVLAYAKLFEELASSKKKFVDREMIVVFETVNSLFSPHLPKKEGDPGSFIVRLGVRNDKHAIGMIDLSVGVNLMP